MPYQTLRYRLLVLVVLISTALAGCTRDSMQPPPTQEIAVIAPASGATLDEGTELFNQYCAVCHGEDGGGRGPFPALNSSQHANMHPDWELQSIVTNGQNSMPAFGAKLSPAQITTLIARVKAWWTADQLAEQEKLTLETPAPTPAP